MSASPSLFRVTLFGFISLVIAVGVGRFAYTPLLPLMISEGYLDVSEGGRLATVHFIGYLFGALIAARLPFSPRLTLQLSLICIGVSTLCMGITNSFLVWSILRGISGICSAFTLVLVGTYYVNFLANMGAGNRQGWIFSGVGTGIGLSGIAVFLFMVLGLKSSAGWYIIGAGSLLLSCILSFRMGAEIPRARPLPPPKTARRTPLIWPLIIAYGAAGIGYVIPATYLPIMAREIVHSPMLFGLSWPIFGLAAGLSTLLAAKLHQKISSRQIWGVSQGIMAVGLILPILVPHISAIIGAGICVGGTFMIITMAGIKEIHRLVPAGDVLRHIAAMTMAFAAGQMIGPVLASLLFDMTHSFAPSLILTSVFLILTTSLLRKGSSRFIFGLFTKF